MLKLDSARLLTNKIINGLKSITNIYKGREGNHEIIPLDKPDEIKVGDTILSNEDLHTIAAARTLDDILAIPTFNNAFATLEKYPSEKFSKTSKNSITDFLNTLKLWVKGISLYSGV